jgi:hypothetical protein
MFVARMTMCVTPVFNTFEAGNSENAHLHLSIYSGDVSRMSRKWPSSALTQRYDEDYL